MGITNISGRVQTTSPAVPQIYAYTTPEIKRHDGWTKIGYTEQDVYTRLEQQTHTVDVEVVLNWHGNAIYADGSGTFRDTDLHAYLRKLGIENNRGTEWFHIEPKSAKQRYMDFCENHGIITSGEPESGYMLRAEQARAVQQTLAYAQAHEQGEYLWNAKPRFGKTLACYDLCLRMHAKRVLIVTNRPAVANSWYGDYVKFIGRSSGYAFVSETDALKDPKNKYCLTRTDFRKQIGTPDGTDRCFEFVSLQDLKGSLHFGGQFDKLEHIADLQWDVLIIDEAHEAVDTYKTDVAFDRITRKFTLHLSGTPFKAITNAKFAEDQIFNWTYADEQQAKRDWDNAELSNPYENLPKLNMLTYKMSDIVIDRVGKGIEIDGETVDYAFDLNEFFATNGSNEHPKFIHDEAADRFLDALTAQTKYPFSTPELRDELRHTLWLLARVNSARALAQKLQNHPVFKDYEVILAAGDGRFEEAEDIAASADSKSTTDADQLAVERTKEAEKAYDKVIHAIRSTTRHKGTKSDGPKKTITLSVGQLTTGVTIPEWTAVLMLSNMKSPALYMQSAFRAQNPCLFNDHGKFRRKENAYVFDFDPARTLTIFEEFANDLYTDTASGGGSLDGRKQRVRTLLNFFPVLGEDENGEMVDLDAEKVLSIPRKIHSAEVVRRGFMCDFLFQNIGSVFRAPQEIVNVLTQLPTATEGDLVGGIDGNTTDELSINAQGEIELPQSVVNEGVKDLLGKARYDVSEDEIKTHLAEAAHKFSKESEDTDHLIESLANQLKVHSTQPIVDAVKKDKGSDFKPSDRRRVERIIDTEINSQVRRTVGSMQIDKRKAEHEREQQLEQARTDEEIASINAEYDHKIEAVNKTFEENVNQMATDLREQAAQIAIRATETSKREEKKRAIENSIKEHLRGFARTIPSFLMAYGDEKTTLENFEKGIPANVFEDVTSITEDEFRLLRDGGTFTNKETGEQQEFAGGIFDPVVFNDSVAEFIALRGRLANYFDESLGEDIFDYVPPQKTNQIFTPRKVVKHMVDMLEEQNPGCFDDPSHTFADLYMKSGLYIAEIIKRLYNSPRMKEIYASDKERLQHILERQVFGIAPTEIIYNIATHYILGYRNEIGRDYDVNFVCADSANLAKQGKLEEFVEETFGSKL